MGGRGRLVALLRPFTRSKYARDEKLNEANGSFGKFMYVVTFKCLVVVILAIIQY